VGRKRPARVYLGVVVCGGFLGGGAIGKGCWCLLIVEDLERNPEQHWKNIEEKKFKIKESKGSPGVIEYGSCIGGGEGEGGGVSGARIIS